MLVTNIIYYTMYCNRNAVLRLVLFLFSCSCLHADTCNQLIVLQGNTSLPVCDTSCGDAFSNNAINCKLSFPSKPLLTVSLEQTHWVTAVRIHNTDSVGLIAYSLAYTDRDSTDVIPIPLATLYNSSLPSGDIVEVDKGGYLLIKLQKPVQPVSLSVFGYGAVGSAGCISVELLGCLPRDLSYPIHTSNLLQYRLSLPDNLCANCTGVEHGYWYGSDGVLTDGIEHTESTGCINTECLHWEASNHPSGISIFFQFYQPANIQFIELFQTSNINSIAIKSPGTVPPYQTNYTSPYTYTITLEAPINTDYIQIEIHFQHTLTLTEIKLHDSNGNSVLESVVSINEDMTSPDYFTALIASTMTLLFLLFLSFFAIIAFSIIAYRTHTKLCAITYFYDTLTPETFAIYTSIKRTPKYREYVNVARMYSNIMNKSDFMDKSTQPLPKRPDSVVRRMSATSSITVGDYEKIDHILRQYELNRNNNNTVKYGVSSSPAKRSLVKTLSNGLTFFNRSRNNVKPDKRNAADVIAYDSSQTSPNKHYNHEDPYTPYNPVVIRQNIPPGEESNNHIPLTMSVSNNHLYKVNASRHSPTHQPANFQFVEDTSEQSAKQLAGITLSQLNDSISSDSV